MQMPKLRLMGITIGLISLLLTSCFPYSGPKQRPMPSTPFSFFDAENGNPIQQVLVLPKYSTSRILSTGAGDGPGGESYQCYWAHSFVYERGKPFAPQKGRSFGIVWGLAWAYTGTNTTLDGVTFIARGYRPFYFSSLSGEDVRLRSIALGRISEAETNLLAVQLIEAIHEKGVAGTNVFRGCGHVRLTSSEIAEITAFVQR